MFDLVPLSLTFFFCPIALCMILAQTRFTGTHIEANFVQKREDLMSANSLTDEDRCVLSVGTKVAANFILLLLSEAVSFQTVS